MDNSKLTENKVSEILTFPYSHHDYEWVCTRAWHKWRYIKAFCEVLDEMKKDESYTWHIDNVVHSWVPFLKYCPERVEEFKKYVKEGRICVLNGGVSLARPSQVGEETYVRNMIEGRRFFEKQFDINDIPVLYNADTGVGHSQMPQIAKLGGHKYYRFQRPDGLLTQKGVPLQFWWKGLDGTRLLIARGAYGGFWNEVDWLNLDPETNWEEKKENYYQRELSDRVNDNFSSDIVFQFVGNDDCRPKRDFKDVPHDLNKFMEEWNSREPSKMRYSTLSEAFKLLESKELPEWDGVLDHAELSYNFPSKGMRSMWRRRLELDHAILELEKLSIIAEELGFEYPEKEIKAMWSDLFEITGHAIEDIQDRDNKELVAFAERAKYNVEVLTRKTRENIINAVKKDDKLQIVVINTLNRETEQTVRFQVTDYCGLSGFDIVDKTNNVLNYQIVDIFEEYRSFKDSEYAGVEVEVKVLVPAMGYTTLKIVPNGKKLKDKVEATFIDNLPANYPENAPDEVKFNNREIEVCFNNGKVSIIKNLKTGKIIEAKENNPLISLRYEEIKPAESWLINFHDILNVWEFTPECGKILANGPVRFTYKAFGKIKDQDVSITYTLNSGEKGIKMQVETDFKDAIEGMLWFSVSADIDSEVFADIPYGKEKREFYNPKVKDKGSVEPIAVVPCEFEYPTQVYARNFTSFTSSGAPMALVSKNCSCYYLFDKNLGEMKIILSRALPMKYRTDRWMGECPADFDMTGKNTYDLAVFFPEENGKFADIQKYHKEYIYPAFADQSFGFVGGG